MICWPHYVDQQVNRRHVGEFWKLGLDMKDTCDRVTVERMIKELMDSKKEEFLKRADRIANVAMASVNKGGFSYKNLKSRPTGPRYQVDEIANIVFVRNLIPHLQSFLLLSVIRRRLKIVKYLNSQRCHPLTILIN